MYVSIYSNNIDKMEKSVNPIKVSALLTLIVQVFVEQES